MPALNIKDPQVRALAAELATMRGTSMTDAVRHALEAALALEETACKHSRRTGESKRPGTGNPATKGNGHARS